MCEISMKCATTRRQPEVKDTGVGHRDFYKISGVGNLSLGARDEASVVRRMRRFGDDGR
jgi:hypothetical protein